MRTLLLLCSIVHLVASGMRCSTAEHCGAPAVNAKCINHTCEFFLIENREKRAPCGPGSFCEGEATCIDGECVVLNGNGGVCGSSAPCPNGYICVNKECQVFKRRLAPQKRQACSTNIECTEPAVCDSGRCVLDNGHGQRCADDSYCVNGWKCVKNRCEPISRHFGPNQGCPEDCKPPSCVC